MKRIVLIAIMITLIAIPSPTAYAQTGGGYDLTWSTIDGGGYTFHSGAPYLLGGAAGQPDAQVLSGGAYTVFGGFWSPRLAYYYLPVILKNP